MLAATVVKAIFIVQPPFISYNHYMAKKKRFHNEADSVAQTNMHFTETHYAKSEITHILLQPMILQQLSSRLGSWLVFHGYSYANKATPQIL